MRAAKLLGVAPWELIEQPLLWMNMALQFESDEQWVEGETRKRWEKQRPPRAR